MANPKQASPAPVGKPGKAFAQPARDSRAARVDVSESFRNARSGLAQISADFTRLRQQATALVKGAHRTPK